MQNEIKVTILKNWIAVFENSISAFFCNQSNSTELNR